MYKAYKFRLYPNKEQKELINKSFGSCRFVYNYYLSNIKNKGYQNAYSNISDYVNNLKYEYTFLQEVDSTIIRKTLFYLDNNLKKYYNNSFGYLYLKDYKGNNLTEDKVKTHISYNEYACCATPKGITIFENVETKMIDIYIDKQVGETQADYKTYKYVYDKNKKEIKEFEI